MRLGHKKKILKHFIKVVLWQSFYTLTLFGIMEEENKTQEMPETSYESEEMSEGEEEEKAPKTKTGGAEEEIESDVEEESSDEASKLSESSEEQQN